MSLNKVLLFIGFLLNSLPIFALSTDQDQPIQIKSDAATIDNLKGTAIYKGNVVITQGTIRINAEKVTLTYTEKQDLKKVMVEGNPARFKQRPDKSEEDVHATANLMEYYAAKNMLYLVKEAKLWQGKDSFIGQRISYDTVRGVIKADKGNSKNGRVIVTIQPRRQQK